MWTCFASLLLFFPALKCSQLLLLKQRQRLQELFHYELSECISSARQLSPNLWTAPKQASFVEDGSIQAKYLSSVRSVIDIIAFGGSPMELIDNVRGLKISQPLPWSIEYECLAPLEDASPGTAAATDGTLKERQQISATISSKLPVDRKSFSSKTLFCAISQCIQGPPALDPREALAYYYLLETKEGFHLGFCTEPLNPTVAKQSNCVDLPISQHAPLNIKELWAGRPFIFSAALNIEIAEAVMNILHAKLKAKKDLSEDMVKDDTVFTVLDPCCGSGTTLFVARRLGFRAIGSDVNAFFVAGAERNLNYAGFSTEEKSESESSLSGSDGTSATSPLSQSMGMQSHSKALLQLYCKDASCSISTWKPYRKEIRESDTSDLSKEGKQNDEGKQILQDINLLKTEVLEGGKKGEGEGELSAAGQASAVIPTEGRTKRFLQSSKAIRTSNTNTDTNSNSISNTITNTGTISNTVSNTNTNTDTNGDPYAQWGIVDCVFCNFPWGENIFEYHNETEDILTVLGQRLKKGCECAFVTKEMLPKNILEERGFLLKEVIPIRDEKKKDRAVPYSKKNRDRDSNGDFGNQTEGHTGDCFVSFAVVV